ncbi:MAG: hypothetical protein C0501_05600 [Isosphaera sp.]|nr:hypothetical protein [Isosphaera sp.]
MVTARRVGKWGLYAAGGAVLLVVLARVGLGAYLSTAAGKEMVARRIADQIGMPVEVTAVRVGLVTSSIGMRVFDPAAPDPGHAEVFSVDEAKADISLFALVLGRVDPDWVDLRGANLTLHVSADGDVITTLPKAPTGGGAGTGFPVIRLADARLTIRQDGRPEFALQNLTLTAEPAGDTVRLTGAVDDPAWAKWSVSGEINRALKTGAVELATENGPLTMDRLGSVPFVPPAVWESVRPDGRGAIAVRLWAGADREVQYAVDIRPAAAALTLPDASVTLENVTGVIRVAGAKVELVGTKANVAGGALAITGELDFGREPTVIDLKVAGSGLDIRKLPPEWKLPDPKVFEGLLGGTADIVVRIHADGRVEYDGTGEGAITGVKVLGVPQEDDIPITLRKRGKRFEFQQDKPTPKKVGFVAREQVRCTSPRQDKKDPPKKDPPKKDDDGPTTLDATVRFRDIDVAELLDKLNVKLGYKLAGKVTVEAALAVPLGQAASLSAYQFTGSVSSPALTFEGLTVRDASAKMTYRDGKLTLTDLSGKIDPPGKAGGVPGTFRGTATAAVSPPGDATASLVVDRVPLGEALKAVPGFAADIRGTVSGKVNLKAPYEKLWDTTLWSGSADLSAPELVVEGRTAKDVRARGTVAKGVLTISDAAVTVEGIPVTAEATVGLADTYAFTAVVRTTGTDVTDLRKLVPEVEIPAPISGVLETETKVTGTASPLTYRATGTVKASKLTLAKSTANQVTAAWELTEERLRVSSLKAEAFGGTLTGSADVPFDRAKAGKFEVAFKDVDAAGATELVPDFPVRIAGKVSGKVGGAIPPAKPGQARVGNIDLELTAPRLTVQGVPAEKLVGTASYEAGVVRYSLEGKTLGGSFEITGRYPGQKKKDEKEKAPGPERGSLRVTGVDLARISRDVGIPALAPLRGRVDANFTFADDLSAGSGRVVLTGLKWGDTPVSRELTGVLILREGRLELADVSGALAGGLVRARASVRLDDTTRNFFSITVTGADPKRLLAPFGASEVDIDGPVSVAVRGRVGRETRASGSLTLPRGSVSGAQVTDLRVPFEFASARGGYGRLTIREAMAQAGSGRARADLTVDFGYETKVDGLVTFVDVPLRAVVPSLGEGGLFGNGRITGRFDVAGRNVRSVADLTGTLNATLNQTSVREIPLLRQVTPFLNPSGLTKPFDAGDVKGRLANGVFRVERLALANPAAQLFAEGSVTLGGRVDLDVVAHTGPIGPDAGGLRVLIRRLPLFGPIPVGLVRDVTNFLSNRTVRLTVTGTTANPVVRVNVGALLTEEAVRFFLTRYVLPAGLAGGVLGGSEMRR